MIERNGKRHSSAEALAHIKKKYDYFRDRIRTTEDFILLSASKSTMSGKSYTVSCDGLEHIQTRDWLMQELNEYRGEKRMP